MHSADNHRVRVNTQVLQSLENAIHRKCHLNRTDNVHLSGVVPYHPSSSGLHQSGFSQDNLGQLQRNERDSRKNSSNCSHGSHKRICKQARLSWSLHSRIHDIVKRIDLPDGTDRFAVLFVKNSLSVSKHLHLTIRYLKNSILAITKFIPYTTTRRADSWCP
jgi:hypothetical protein